MRDLLLIACSARKPSGPQRIAALERYDGVFFRVLRRRLRIERAKSLDVLIISARFGLIEHSVPIPDYDQQMTQRRAAELAPEIQSALGSQLERGCYRRIFLNVGRNYLATLSGIDELQSASWARGGIGMRAEIPPFSFPDYVGVIEDTLAFIARETAQSAIAHRYRILIKEVTWPIPILVQSLTSASP